MVKCLPEFEYFFTVFLKNRNFISKIRISKATDYADLSIHWILGMFIKRMNRVYLLDLFCSGIQLYVLLSPYLCFISFLYLDLYVPGDDVWIS